MIRVLKKNGLQEDFNFDKIIVAVNKSANRIGKELTCDKVGLLQKEVLKSIHKGTVTVDRIHQIVELALSKVDMEIADSYRGYRNWVKEKAMMMETVEGEIDKAMNERDRSNSNLNSLLFSARRTNVSKILLSEMFTNIFLLKDESQATKDGFIYPHDKDNRLIATHNCCVVKLENIMDNGFWINGYFCKEPKDIVNAVGVVGDIIVTCASAQYGGFSCAEIDTTLAKYCEKSYQKWKSYFKSLNIEGDAGAEAYALVQEELENALQGLEFQLNTRESSRGDYPFVTFSFGKDTSFWGREVAKALLKIRRKGHGDKVKQKVVFPKLVCIVRRDGQNRDIFKEAIKTSMVALYPDYISDDVATPMGCRSFLSDYFLEDGTNLLWGRGNIGVVTLNLPLIYQNAKTNGLPFVQEINKYVDMIRDIHVRTYDLIGKQIAGSNPIMFMEGGFYGGHLKWNDKIEPIVKKYFTASFGITALNELSVLATGKTLREDSTFANNVIDCIQRRIDHWKSIDGYAYSIYGTPAESLCGKQVEQFRAKFGIIEGVSDRDYFSNSFHLHVSEDISPFEKQDKETELFHRHSGGHIQYVRITNPENLKAVEDIVLRGVLENGLYQGTNINACTCNHCGHNGNDFNGACPKCGSTDYNEFNRICGYLGFTKKHGDWTLNDAKISEVKERVSM